MKRYDVCILGGGAAGLAAAASLDKDIKICMLEKNKILGRKILATGGGKCNITNKACRFRELTMDFFKSLGMELYCDSEGRYYPYSNRAEDVVTVLKKGIETKNIHIEIDFTVKKVSYESGLFKVYGKGESFLSEKLLVAVGGKAAPSMGTTGDGYRFAKELGHNIERVYPVLTGIECGDFRDIKGVRARGKVTLLKEGREICEQTGEIQFTEDGISGICVMNLTLYIKAEEGENIRDSLKRYEVLVDLAPDFAEKDVEGRSSSFGILSEKLSRKVSIGEIKSWKLPVKGIKGWKNAQCTGGGVSLDEIDMETMESKIVKGLYFAGEILDFQRECGGFNLQNAWETGIKAASHINGSFK